MTEMKFSRRESKPKCVCESTETLIESQSSGIPIHNKANTKNVSLDKAKVALSKPSSFTNDTLYDHLVEIIKRVIDERPPDVIDYFEQFSRDVRERKYSKSVTPPPEPKFLDAAKAVLKSTEVIRSDEIENLHEEAYEDGFTSATASVSSASTLTKMHRTLALKENVIQVQHYWDLCGFGFQADEIFQLSWAIQKIQCHHTIRSARFWGKIFGLNASYFIVEADLSKSEKMLRMDQMEANLVEEMIAFIKKKEMCAVQQQNEPELISGFAWQDPSQGELKNLPQVAPVPRLTFEETFETPPEPIGTGLNRKTYFVTRCLSDDWQELPLVTPKQIVASRKIRKYLTGNIEARLSCYPAFPGTEKNYLRALIARVTAGTYIAPEGYFRKMTQKERLAVEGENDDVGSEGQEQLSFESDFDNELEEDANNNDWPMVENENYLPLLSKELKLPKHWVHCRPHILEQGSVTHIDEESVIRNLTKVALRRIRQLEIGNFNEGGEEEDGLEIETDIESDAEHNEEEDFSEEENQRTMGEAGPELFTSANNDCNSENVEPWSSRFSEHCNSSNQAVIMRSNLWPGAYTFVNDRYCDSIYLGWGTKFVARCGAMDHLPAIQNIHYPDDVLEATDPSVEMEERWRRFHLRRDTIDAGADAEEMSYSIEVDNDDLEG